MPEIHIKTLFLTILFGHIISLIIFSYNIYNRNTEGNKIKIFIYGILLELIATLFGYLEVKSHSNFLLLSSVLTHYFGIAFLVYSITYINKVKTSIQFKRLMIITFIAFVLYTCFINNVMYRVFLNGLFLSSLFLFLFYKTIFDSNQSRPQYVVGIIALFCVFANGNRAVQSIMGSELYMFQDNIVQIIWAISYLLITYFFPLLLLFSIQEQNLKLVKDLNNTKDIFFKVVAHDLKSPIIQMIQLAESVESNKEDLDKDIIIDFVREMRQSSERGFKVLENLMEWAKSQTEGIVFNPTTFSAKALIEENIALAQGKLDKKHITISTFHDDFESITADKHMLNTIVRNLLSNAIKFTYQNGNIFISFKQSPEEITFSIKDDGKGMTSKELDKLFKIESSFTTPGTNDETGTGIGLLLCKEFVNKHNGKIWAESELGKGSTFSFSIPVQ